MTVKVKIPTQLRSLTGGSKEIEVPDAVTVRDLLDKMGADYPQLLERVVDDEGELRRFVNLYVGDEDVRFLDGLNTELASARTVSILPAVAGGSRGVAPLRSEAEQIRVRTPW